MRAALHILAVAAAVTICARAAAQDDDIDPADQIRLVERSIVASGKFFRDKKYAEAAAELKQAKERLDAIKPADVPGSLRPQYDKFEGRLKTAEQALAKRKATEAKAAPAAKKKPADASQGEPAKAKKSSKAAKSGPAAPAGPSFTADVAPILIARCGNCHIRAAQGRLSMANFASLAAGSRNGPIITPGASQASRLVEVLVDGDMPKGGGQISPDEVMVIARWIDAGANFDGADRTAPLGQPAVPGMPRAGTDGVLFTRDLAPAIVENCLECHSGEKPAGKLRVETFDSFMAGGGSGKAVEPGKPQESLLMKKLRAIPAERMPKNKLPLSSDRIAAFEAWIRRGAKFDGDDPAAPLKDLVERTAADRMSHDELSAKRLAQAEKLWAKAFPDNPAEQTETTNFLLLGNTSKDRLAEVGKLAETERGKIVKLLKLDAETPLVKGGLVLFVFKRAADYGAFVKASEERETAKGTNGHFHGEGPELYAALVAASANDEILPALAAEQVAGGFLLGFGIVPEWFAVGAARTIAARVEPKSPLVKKWDTEMQGATAADDAEALMAATAGDAESIARSYAFVRALAQKMPQFQSLVAALGQEEDFDQVLASVYRSDARTLVDRWLKRKPPGR